MNQVQSFCLTRFRYVQIVRSADLQNRTQQVQVAYIHIHPQCETRKLQSEHPAQALALLTGGLVTLLALAVRGLQSSGAGFSVFSRMQGLPLGKCVARESLRAQLSGVKNRSSGRPVKAR